MSIFNPKMLTLARESRGLTQEQFANLVPTINQGNLSKIEKGLLGASYMSIEHFSNVLGYPVNFFYQPDSRPAFSTFYYRKQAKVSGKTLKQLAAKIKIYSRAIGYLLDEVQMERPFERLKFDSSDGWTPKKAANMTRQILGIPDGPIQDIVSLIEKAGIIVYFLEYDVPGFDGLATITDNGWPIIFINNSKPNDRKRMNIAHELCHIGMHIPFIVEPYRDEEKEAREYASEFLMPSAEVKSDLLGLTYYALADLKEYWKVSKSSLIYKAHELGTIPNSTYQYLNIELGRRKERINENGYVDIDTPKLLDKIIALYKNELGYSHEELATITHLSQKEFIEVFENKGNQPKIRRLSPTI